MRVIALALMITALLVSQSFAQAPPLSLTVQGNRLVDSSGATVQLRGVNRSGTEYMCVGGSSVFDGPATQASIDAMKSWAINAVRLPINESCWLGINGAPGGSMTVAQYRQGVVDFIRLLNANGMYAIFDLQWAEAGTTVPSFNLQAMPNAEHSIAFWQSAAETLKDNQAVIFDLFNEPYPNGNADDDTAWRCLRDGQDACPASNTVNTKGEAYVAAGTQTLVDTIRATGAKNVIQVPGVQFANGLSKWLQYKPNDPLNNLVADWHSYAGQVCAPQSCWETNVAPVAAQVPIVAGEIGESDCQGIYIKPLMDWLDGHQASYLAWAWNTYDCSGFPALITSYDGTPSSFGVDYRNHLLTRAGVTTPTPVLIPLFNGGKIPFGLRVGSSETFVGTDGTSYLPDVPSAALNFYDGRYFQPYRTTAQVTNTADPLLYQTGRYGMGGTWTINVPNGSYRVSLGVAPTGYWTSDLPRWDWTKDAPNQPIPSILHTGEYGQDHYLQSQKIWFCHWSNTSGCLTPGEEGSPAPNVASVLTYKIDVFNQHLSIQVAPSFGDGRTTILNMIKVEQAGGVPSPTVMPTRQPTQTAVVPTMTATPAPAGTCRVEVIVNEKFQAIDCATFLHTDWP